MADLVVQTKQGKISGVEKFGSLNFRAIPYAAPPVGDLRWRSPQPTVAWDGVRDGSEFGPVCPQNPGQMEGLNLRREQPPQSEDCLTLNVWTRDLGAQDLPVAVWIHGGAFNSGSGRVPWYHAHNFARDGVVCVTVNYRVSALGFLCLDELFDGFDGSGTLGIQDQVAALEWVQENIAAFGGDPSNVTIFGESAGGGSVGTLLAFPSAKGMFHKAIPQSGASHWSHPPEIGARVARRFCKDAGVEPGDIEALQALPVERVLEICADFGQVLISSLTDLFGEDYSGAAMPFQPVADGITLPERPINAVLGGSARGVPVIVGTTRDEWKLFAGLGADHGRSARTPKLLQNLCRENGKSIDELVGAYEKATDGSEAEVRGALETDRLFWIPAVRVAEAQAANDTPVWMYRFDWATPVLNGRLGACHALEIPFVFDNLEAPGADVFTGGVAPQALATNMHAAWVSFMKTGDPSTSQLPPWPGYDTETRSTMMFDAECKVVDDPNRELRELWEGLL